MKSIFFLTLYLHTLIFGSFAESHHDEGIYEIWWDIWNLISVLSRKICLWIWENDGIFLI